MKSTGFPLLEYSQGSSMGLMSQPYYCSPRLSINNFISRESLMIGNQDISHSLIPQTISDYSHFAPPMSYAPQVIGNLQIIQSHNDCKCKCLCSCTQCSCSLNNSKALGCDSGLQPILPQKEETYVCIYIYIYIIYRLADMYYPKSFHYLADSPRRPLCSLIPNSIEELLYSERRKLREEY